jgi:hypothetical protein
VLNDGADLEETVPSQSDRRKQLRLGLCVPAGLASRRRKQGRARAPWYSCEPVRRKRASHRLSSGEVSRVTLFGNKIAACCKCPAQGQAPLKRRVRSGATIPYRIGNLTDRSVNCPSRLVGLQNWSALRIGMRMWTRASPRIRGGTAAL